MLPFLGVAHVAYLPEARVVGLSKLARLVEHRSRGLRTQERLTTEVADVLDERLAPRGVGVAIEATHLCMSIRGIQASGATTVTTAVRGAVRDDPSTQAEFTRLTIARRHGG
jgi:GTP cyclohydrolase I